MCGRYSFDTGADITEINKIMDLVNSKYSSIKINTGEIFPTNQIPILKLEDNKPVITVMSWGFPRWDNKGVIVNAKSETAKEKKMFSSSLIERRCVIPSTGFYEWNHNPSSPQKEKYIFQSDISPMLYMAGIYSLYTENNNIKEKFVILTKQSNKYINDIHERMPVILLKNELNDWISDKNFIEYAICKDNIKLIREKINPLN